MSIQSSLLYERWLSKFKHQPGKAIDPNFIIISSFNPMKSKRISITLSNTNLQNVILNVST